MKEMAVSGERVGAVSRGKIELSTTRFLIRSSHPVYPYIPGVRTRGIYGKKSEMEEVSTTQRDVWKRTAALFAALLCLLSVAPLAIPVVAQPTGVSVYLCD